MKRVIALVLVFCMLLGTGGQVAFAAESSGNVQDYFYKVFHLDAARKYFSVENIKDIVDTAADAGYNQIELYLSDNQGFRLGLDDMTVTTEFGTYDMTPALGAGYSQDPHYTDGKEVWLTQQEMDEIIAYANSKGLGVVPCINAPGHMGALLEAFPQFRYSATINGTETVSKSALDLWNEEAYAFGLAFIEKYARYFQSRGVTVFNFGADEYGCDLMTNNGTGENNGMDIVYNNGGYDDFVDFINDEIALLKEMGLQPRAFSDCIYYTGTDVYNGETLYIDTDLEICYWNGGWYWSNWFRRADADYLADKGFRMINTNGDYYHILGGTLCTPEKASQFDYKEFHTFNTSKEIYLEDVAGAMFCLWSDDARDSTCTSDEAVAGVLDSITAFGGTLPTAATASVKHTATGITVSAPGLTAVAAAEENAPDVGEVDESVAYIVEPVTAFGSYYGQLEITLPIPADFAQNRTRAAVVNADGIVDVSGEIENGKYVISFHYDATQAPVVVLYEVPCEKAEVEVDVNEIVKIVTDTDLTGTYTVADPAIADVEVTVNVTEQGTVPGDTKVTSLTSGSYYLYNGKDYLIVQNGALKRVSEEKAEPWTVTVSSSGVCNFKQGSYYLSNSYSASAGYVFKALTSTPYASWSYNSNGIYANLYGANYYFCYNTNGWFGGDASNAYAHYAAYEAEEIPAAVESTITFTGKAAGTTTVEIGNTEYIITVKAIEATEPEVTEPEVTEPETTEPETTEPETTEPETTEPETTEPETTEPETTEPETTEPETTEPEVTEPEITEPEETEPEEETPEEYTFWLTHYNSIDTEGNGSVMTKSYSGGSWNLHVAFAPCEEENVYEITAISDGTDKGAGKALSIPSGGFVYSLNQGNDWPSLYASNPSAYSWYSSSPDYTSAACDEMLERALEWSVGDRFVIEGLDLSGSTVPTSTSSLKWYDDAYVCTATYYAYEEPEVTEPEETEPEVTEPEVTEPEVTEPEVTEPEVTEPEVTEPEETEPEVTEPEEPAETFTFWLTHYNTVSNEGSGAVMTSSYSGGSWNLHVAFAPCEEENVYEITAISDGTDKGAGKALSIPSGGFVYSLNQGNDWPSLYAADPSTYSWYADYPDYTSDACNEMLERALEWSVGDRFVIEGLDLSGKTVPTSTSSLKWYSDAYECTATYYEWMS